MKMHLADDICITHTFYIEDVNSKHKVNSNRGCI